MAQSDRLRKKKPTGGGGAGMEMADLSGEVPSIEDILASVDAALEKADNVSEILKRPKQRVSSCGC